MLSCQWLFLRICMQVLVMFARLAFAHCHRLILSGCIVHVLLFDVVGCPSCPHQGARLLTETPAYRIQPVFCEVPVLATMIAILMSGILVGNRCFYVLSCRSNAFGFVLQ